MIKVKKILFNKPTMWIVKSNSSDTKRCMKDSDKIEDVSTFANYTILEKGLLKKQKTDGGKYTSLNKRPIRF